MGHMLKNTVFRSGSHALGVPTGTSSIGPDSPQNGQPRYNTTTGKLEFYNNTVWNAVAKEGNVAITKTSFTGNGVAVKFGPIALSSGDENKVIVHVGTVYQVPTTNYTFDATGEGNIIFGAAPSGGAAITIISGFSSTISTLA